MEKLTIGKGLKRLNYDYIFHLCPNLKHITFNAIAIDEKEFDPYHTFRSCQAPVETLVFGDDVKYVPGMLFFDCSTLKNVTLGKSVEIIGEAAFRACSGITKIELPNSLKIIDKYAFYDTNIENIFIPECVESLGTWGFGNIKSLKSVISVPSNAPKNSSSFISNSDYTLYVPDIKGYSNGWEQYRSNMQSMIKSDTEEYYYNGKAPEFTLTSNIPNYELTSMSIGDTEVNAGNHSVQIIASFKGERDFTTTITHYYTINKGKQEINWEQDLSNITVGDEIILNATSTSGLEITYSSSEKNIELKQVDGNTIMVCKAIGDVVVKATQQGDENWEAATTVTKNFTIIENSTGIVDCNNDNNSSILGYYNLAGKKLNSVQKGINIVKYSNGSTKKVIIR